MRATLAFCERHDFEWVNMYPCFAYPGTALFDPARAPASWHAYSLYGPDCSPMGTEHLSPAEVLAFRDRAFVRYHGRPSYLARIEGRFGPDTRAHVERMVARPLRRRLLEGG
jgi:hypothetical protein